MHNQITTSVFNWKPEPTKPTNKLALERKKIKGLLDKKHPIESLCSPNDYHKTQRISKANI